MGRQIAEAEGVKAIEEDPEGEQEGEGNDTEVSRGSFSVGWADEPGIRAYDFTVSLAGASYSTLAEGDHHCHGGV